MIFVSLPKGLSDILLLLILNEVIVMEIMTIVGMRYVDFKDDSGKQVSGYSLYYTMKADRVEGVIAGKLFISDDRAAGMVMPEVGQTYEVFYDRYGRPNKFVSC